MTPLLRLAVLLLSASLASAQGTRVTVEVPLSHSAPSAAPAATLTAPSLSPGVMPVPMLAAPITPSAAPAAAVAAPVMAAPMAAMPVMAAPALSPAPAFAAARPAASAGAERSAPSAEFAALEGRQLFDQASRERLIAETASRPLKAGVFIQQEQEGSLLAPDSRDSTGNIFLYYRPVEMRADLAAKVQSELSGVEKIGFKLRSAFSSRKNPYAAWNAWPLSAKLKYLDALDKAVTVERGPPAAWNGKIALLLTKVPGAPDFITEHPHMEAPPAAYKNVAGARYLQPEIVSDRDHPAPTIGAALGRSKFLIAQTGHAGTQYHVFIKADPAVLNAQLPALESALQFVNNILFVKAAQDSHQNVVHASLQPWHRGRSDRVAALIKTAQASPHSPQAEDPDSEKHAAVGLRYWGTENGKLVVSFELRGASLPFKSRKKSMVRDMEDSALPERDYSQAQFWLTLLSLYAEKLVAGRAPALGEPPVVLDAAAADALLAARAKQLGMPAEAYYGVADFARRMTGEGPTPPGYLFPFAASRPDSPALRAFMDEWLKESARVRGLDRVGPGAFDDQHRNVEYVFWSAYREWAQSYEAGAARRLDALLSASAAP